MFSFLPPAVRLFPFTSKQEVSSRRTGHCRALPSSLVPLWGEGLGRLLEIWSHFSAGYLFFREDVGRGAHVLSTCLTDDLLEAIRAERHLHCYLSVTHFFILLFVPRERARIHEKEQALCFPPLRPDPSSDVDQLYPESFFSSLFFFFCRWVSSWYQGELIGRMPGHAPLLFVRSCPGRWDHSIFLFLLQFGKPVPVFFYLFRYRMRAGRFIVSPYHSSSYGPRNDSGPLVVNFF